ncbi:hypothetical protein Droror1_Dr00008466, partial [Drosera rotundifolia]
MLQLVFYLSCQDPLANLHICPLHTVNSEARSPTSQVPSLDIKTSLDITESLRMQMEVQKQLHEQLE